MKSKKGNYYVIEGSGNLSFNSRIEQFIIDNDKKIYDFTISWISHIQGFLKNKKEFTIYE